MDIYWGMQNLFCHQNYKYDQNELKDKYGNGHAEMPAKKLFEQFGEAIPQFVIAITFYANYAHCLPKADLIFGICTMVMSGGSIVMGVGSGFWTCCRYFFYH